MLNNKLYQRLKIMICHLLISRTQRCDDRDVHVVAVGDGVKRSVRLSMFICSAPPEFSCWQKMYPVPYSDLVEVVFADCMANHWGRFSTWVQVPDYLHFDLYRLM